MFPAASTATPAGRRKRALDPGPSVRPSSKATPASVVTALAAAEVSDGRGRLAPKSLPAVVGKSPARANTFSVMRCTRPSARPAYDSPSDQRCVPAANTNAPDAAMETAALCQVGRPAESNTGDAATAVRPAGALPLSNNLSDSYPTTSGMLSPSATPVPS